MARVPEPARREPPMTLSCREREAPSGAQSDRSLESVARSMPYTEPSSDSSSSMRTRLSATRSLRLTRSPRTSAPSERPPPMPTVSSTSPERTSFTRPPPSQSQCESSASLRRAVTLTLLSITSAMKSTCSPMTPLSVWCIASPLHTITCRRCFLSSSCSRVPSTSSSVSRGSVIQSNTACVHERPPKKRFCSMATSRPTSVVVTGEVAHGRYGAVRLEPKLPHSECTT
mmetsp:Transcript_14884/g.45476  ORF Transcript_14884/g.45476 Transcript_14884/m.45476 type:complete len:229 (+) Transcript_14884:2485-3171(+)